MKKILLICLLFSLCFIPIVNAEIATGLMESSDFVQLTHLATDINPGEETTFTQLAMWNIETFYGFESIVNFPGRPLQLDAGAPSGAQTDVSGTIGLTVIFNGTIGYQRTFNLAGVETGRYVYIYIPEGLYNNLHGFTGTQYVTLTFNHRAVFNMTGVSLAQTSTINQANFKGLIIGVMPGELYGSVFVNKRQNFKNSYSINNAIGMGSRGVITKTVSGITYPSRVFVYNTSSNTMILSEALTNSNDFTFDMFQTHDLNITVLTAKPAYLSSGTLFNSGAGAGAGINYALTLDSYTDVITGGYKTATLSPTTDIYAINYYRIQLGDGEPTQDTVSFYESGSTTNQLNYVNKSGTWYGYNTVTQDFTNNKGATMPNEVALYFPDAGNYQIGVFVYTVSSGLFDVSAGDINVIDTIISNANLLLYAADATTSQFITPVSYNIKNMLTSTWSNYTSYLPDGSRTVSYAKGTPLAVYVGAVGYTNTSFTIALNGNNIITTPLTPTNLYIPPTNLNWTNLQVTVKFTNDGIAYYPLSGASVSTETFDPADPISTQYANTDSNGVVFFTVLNQSHNHPTQYSTVITSIIPNYKTVSKSVYPSGNLYTVQLWTQSNAIISPTNVPTIIPITPTPTATPAPVITPPAWEGTNGTAGVVCGTITGNTTLIDSLKINLACNGVQGAQAQSLTIAGLIILIFVMAGSRYGRGLGGAFGGIIGFVISLAMGFIPFWVFAALIVLAGLAAAILITKQQ